MSPIGDSISPSFPFFPFTLFMFFRLFLERFGHLWDSPACPAAPNWK